MEIVLNTYRCNGELELPEIRTHWKSACLILSPKELSWFTVGRVYWKKTKHVVNVVEPLHSIKIVDKKQTSPFERGG